MRNLKLIIFMFVLNLFGIYSDCSAKIRIIFLVGSHSENEACVGDHGICVIIRWRIVDDQFDLKDLGDNMGIADIEMINGKMKMDIVYDNSKDRFDPEFEVSQNMTVSKEVCEALGYQSIVIQEGHYNLNFSKFQYGSVDLNVEAN